MWFKNVQLFHLLSGVSGNAAQLCERWQETLQDLAFEPCLSSLARGFGWVEPWRGAELVTQLPNGGLLLCLQIEEKILPPAVVRHELAERCAVIEAEEGHKLAQKRKRALQDDIISTLLPRAFSKYQKIHAIVDLERNWILVDTISTKYLEMFWAAVKRAFPEWRVDWIEAKQGAAQLTRWCKDGAGPDGVDVLKAAVLQDPQHQQRVIRCQHQELLASPIQTLLNEGCQVTQLALSWRDQCQFTITEQMQLRSLRFSDEVLESAKSQYGEEDHQRHLTDLLIMVENLRSLYQDLLDALDSSTHSSPVPAAMPAADDVTADAKPEIMEEA